MRAGPLAPALAATLALAALGGCVYAPEGSCGTKADCVAGEACTGGVCVREADPIREGGGSGGGIDPVSFTPVTFSRRFGRAGTSFALDAIGADLAGNVVVAGALDGTYDFGPTPVTTGAFVAKLAAAGGAPAWGFELPTFSHGRFRTAVLPGGDVLFAGTAIDPTTLDTLYSPGPGGSLVVGRLTGGAGAVVWTREIRSSGAAAPLVPAALATHGADLLVAGTGSGDFGCASGSTASAAFAASLSAADGACTWSRGLATQTISDLEPRGVGEVAIAGLCTPSGASFDPGGGVTCAKGLFVTVLDAGGNPVWARTSTGAGEVTAVRDLAVAPDGTTTLVGDATGVVGFGGAAVDFGLWDRSFVAAWSPAGAPAGVVRPIEAPYAPEQPDAVAFARCAYDRGGKLWIAGRYLGQPTVGDTRFTACRPPACSAAAFLARVERDASGQLVPAAPVSGFLPIRLASVAGGGAFADDLVLFATTSTVAYGLRVTGSATLGSAAWPGIADDLGALRIAAP